MKSALVITEEGRQVVLTPENKVEKEILKAMKSEENNLSLYFGSFYGGATYGNYSQYKSSRLQQCQGGWVREFEDSESVIIVIKEEKNEKATPQS